MYVPRDEEDYFMCTGKLSKALAAHVADADLNGVRVPIRQDDGSYKDAQGDAMLRDDMADYFARLRAPPAPAAVPPPAVVAVAGPPTLGPIRNNGLQEKRKKQMRLDNFA